MMRKLLIKPKEKNAKMYDFKEFKIQKIIRSDLDMCLNSVKMIDAIIGPNHEGLQIELYYKLCHDISKALQIEYTNQAQCQDEGEKVKSLEKSNVCKDLILRFNRRIEQFFILDYNKSRDNGFKEQQIQSLKEQIKKHYHEYKANPQLRFTIQFAFYSYFMYKDSRMKMARKKYLKQNIDKDIIEQIFYLEDSLPIFKNLMGENVTLQNTLLLKQAESMMDGQYYSKVKQIERFVKKDGQQQFQLVYNKIKIAATDIQTDQSDEVINFAVLTAQKSLEIVKPSLIYQDQASVISQNVSYEFEKKYNSNWDCKVGQNFNNYIVNDLTTQYISFKIDRIAFFIIREVPRGANDNYYRLILTKKSLESFHDYVHSFYLKQEQSYKNGSQVISKPTVELQLQDDIERVYNDEILLSGFLLFKEFLNRYYKFVPSFGFKNPKITLKFAYLDNLDDPDHISDRSPEQFFKHFKSFLKQINDNSTEDISRQKSHLYSYDEFQPKNTYLNLNYKSLDFEKIDISSSILSDDIELLLKYQQHKVTLRKIIVCFDDNRKIIAIDCSYWDSNLNQEILTDHYKEFKTSEIVYNFAKNVYPISMQIINGRRLTMKMTNFEYIQIDSDYPDTCYVEKDKDKRRTLYTQLFRPFCEIILGNFQFYDLKTQDLKSQSYYLKMSRQHHILNLIRSLGSKFQIVYDFSQVDVQRYDSLIIYRDQYLLSVEFYQKLEKDLLKGEMSFDWLFGQEKLLNQRIKCWKQYMKDVRNHIIYYWRNLQVHEKFKKNQTNEDDESGLKAATQEAQIIETIESMDRAVEEIFTSLKNKCIFKNDLARWKIEVGYNLGGKSNSLTDIRKMSNLEKEIYIYQLIVMMIQIYDKGFNVSKIDKIEYGQDVFVLYITYTNISCIPELFSVKDILPLLNYYFKSSITDLEDIFNFIKKYDQLEELLEELREQVSSNFRENLAEISNNDLILPQFMRVLYIPFPQLYQSELYLFEKAPRQPATYCEEDIILMHLMILKAQYNTKTPSNTIRKVKYQTQAIITPGIINKIYNELHAKTHNFKKWKNLLDFFKEQVFRFHLFDTTPQLLNQWTDISSIYDQTDFIQYSKQFFFSQNDISVEILINQMRDLFSVLSTVKIIDTIKVIYQIGLAKIQGSLKASQKTYVDFLSSYFKKNDKSQRNTFNLIQRKIKEYISSESQDPDYKDYETKFLEFNDCTNAINTLKDSRPWINHNVKHPKELQADLLEDFNRTIREQFDNVKEKSLRAAKLKNKILEIERDDPDPKKLKDNYYWVKLTTKLDALNQQLVGNILSKKLILKSSKTKHRIFNQFRITKKYLTPLENYLRETRTEPGHEEWLKKTQNILTKQFQVTLVEQIDHQYLPKYREIFNRLDDAHRFTNYDDFEIVTNKTQIFFQCIYDKIFSEIRHDKQGSRSLRRASNLSRQKTISRKKQSSTINQQVTSLKTQATLKNQTFVPGFDKPRNCLDNKYIDINYWPIVSAVRIYYDSDLRVVHFGAKYKFIHPEYPYNNPNDFEGHGFTRYTSESYQSFVEIEFQYNDEGKFEVLAEVSATGIKITDLTFIFGDGKELQGKIKVDSNLNIDKSDDLDDIEDPKIHRKVLSFSGLEGKSGLVNLNQYYFFYDKETQDPEEEHVYQNCDSDDEDYFNPSDDE